MQLHFIPYSLELKEPFGTAHGTRTSTEGMLVALERDSNIGYGEVFMPPYYPENQKTMAEFFGGIDARNLLGIEKLDEALDFVASFKESNSGAKTALDIALHDLFGKESGLSVRKMYEPKQGGSAITTSFTIGIDTIDTMVRKAQQATGFETLKIKLNGENDVAVIQAIRDVTNQNLYVDANQGWGEIEDAISTSAKLVDLGVGLIEQPFKKGEAQKAGELRKSCGAPVVADEDVQSNDDIERLAQYYDGVNIKLMKAGGIREAFKMIRTAKRYDLDVLIGCMTESSIGISASAQIAHLANWWDLDGNLLIKNDTCTGVETVDGELKLSDAPGIGITDDSILRELFELDN